jgi:parvulin-like peptidyl-prolyl isomerase
MAQSIKEKKRARRSGEKTLEATAPDTDRPRIWLRIAITATVIVIILSVVGVFYYQQYVAPFRRAIITVDDRTIDMGYFLKRAREANLDPIKMLEVLVKEQLIALEAPRYVGQVTKEEMGHELKRIAGGQRKNITDSEADEWYRQRLNESGLLDAEYREIVKIHILAGRLQEYLAQRVPTVGEQVHLHVIQADTYREAAKLRARWEAGENFADLCREAFTHLKSKKQGGDLGWVALQANRTGFEPVAVNLAIGEVSEPVRFKPEGPFYLVMVSEKAEVREFDERSLEALKARALQDWLDREMEKHNIKYNFNSEIHAWLKWQLSKK